MPHCLLGACHERYTCYVALLGACHERYVCYVALLGMSHGGRISAILLICIDLWQSMLLILIQSGRRFCSNIAITLDLRAS